MQYIIANPNAETLQLCLWLFHHRLKNSAYKSPLYNERTNDKGVYFNTPQRLTQIMGANTSIIVAGRLTCKTDSIAAPFVLRNMQRMAGSIVGIVEFTFKY